MVAPVTAYASWASRASLQAIADDRLVRGRGTWGQGHRRRRVEDLADLQVVEVWAARPYGRTKSQLLMLALQAYSCQYGRTYDYDEETMLVETVRAFIDRDVKPTVREVEHANEYPEAWIEQMKRIGIYGLAIPEEYGGSPVSTRCYVLVTQELSRGWMSLAGRDGRAHRGGQAAGAVRHRGAEAALPAADGDRRAAGHDGADRAGRRLGSAEHDDHRARPTGTSW